MITIFRRFQHAGFSSEISYFWDKMKIRFCNLRLLKIPVRQMYLQDMHFCPHCTVKKIRDLGYASWILQCYTSKSKSDFFPEASVNRIKTYCNWFLLRPSQSYLRENKKNCQQLTALCHINTNWFSGKVRNIINSFLF